MKPSRIFIIALLLALGLLQYKLWLSPDGVPQYWRLKHQIADMENSNTELQTKNAHVMAEVENLKQGNDAIEERARNDLGLVKPSEVFYQIAQ
jgi:cell division protein FtsB